MEVDGIPEVFAMSGATAHAFAPLELRVGPFPEYSGDVGCRRMDHPFPMSRDQPCHSLDRFQTTANRHGSTQDRRLASLQNVLILLHKQEGPNQLKRNGIFPSWKFVFDKPD